MRLVGGGILVAIVTVVSGCGGGSHHPRQLSPTTATSVVTSTITTGTTEMAVCGTDQLTARASQASGAGGHLAVVVVFTNGSATACTMEGYPTAWFVDASGKELGTTSIDEQGIPAPAVVPLRPGAQASTTVWYDNPAVPFPPCRTTTAAGIRVLPPGQSSSLTVTIVVTICGPPAYPTVGTTPVVAGTAESMF